MVVPLSGRTTQRIFYPDTIKIGAGTDKNFVYLNLMLAFSYLVRFVDDRHLRPYK